VCARHGLPASASQQPSAFRAARGPGSITVSQADRARPRTFADLGSTACLLVTSLPLYTLNAGSEYNGRRDAGAPACRAPNRVGVSTKNRTDLRAHRPYMSCASCLSRDTTSLDSANSTSSSRSDSSPASTWRRRGAVWHIARCSGRRRALWAPTKHNPRGPAPRTRARGEPLRVALPGPLARLGRRGPATCWR